MIHRAMTTGIDRLEHYRRESVLRAHLASEQRRGIASLLGSLSFRRLPSSARQPA